MGETCTDTLAFAAVPEPAGTYQVVVKTRYADANGYPFSAVSVTPLATTTSPVPDRLGGALTGDEIRDRGRLRLEIRSFDDKQLDVHVRLVLPDEIVCDAPTRDLPVFPDRPAKADFAIRNFSGRPGSTYAVFAVMDVADAGGHASALAVSTVSIAERQFAWSAGYRGWLIVAAVLVVVFLAVQRVTRKKG